MKIIYRLMLIVLLSGAFSANAQNMTAFKGWELYSFKDESGWRFSLLQGTNRLKSIAEVTDPRVSRNLKELENKLEELAPGEQIVWSDGRFCTGPGAASKLEMPDTAIKKEIKSLCGIRNLKLVICADN